MIALIIVAIVVLGLLLGALVYWLQSREHDRD